MKRIRTRETVFERGRRLRIAKLRRTLQQMKRKTERDYAQILNPAADALDSYAEALHTLNRAHTAMEILMETARRQAHESGRSPRLLRTAATALAKAQRTFARSEPDMLKVMTLHWNALMALVRAYEDKR